MFLLRTYFSLYECRGTPAFSSWASETEARGALVGAQEGVTCDVCRGQSVERAARSLLPARVKGAQGPRARVSGVVLHQQWQSILAGVA